MSASLSYTEYLPQPGGLPPVVCQQLHLLILLFLFLFLHFPLLPTEPRSVLPLPQALLRLLSLALFVPLLPVMAGLMEYLTNALFFLQTDVDAIDAVSFYSPRVLG